MWVITWELRKTLVLLGSSSLDSPRRQIDLNLNAILPAILRFGHSGKPRKRRGSRLRATNVPAKKKKWKFPRNLFALLSRECRKHQWKNPLMSPIGNCSDLNLHFIITNALGQQIDICAAGLFLLFTKICWFFHRNGDPAIHFNMFYTRVSFQPDSLLIFVR